MAGPRPVAVRSVAHGTFHLERAYEATDGRGVPGAVRRGGQEPLVLRRARRWRLIERDYGFPGRRPRAGQGRLRGRGGHAPSTPSITTSFRGRTDRLHPTRCISTTSKISVSLATLQIQTRGPGTNEAARSTEQGAFLDGYDDAGSRERGTGRSSGQARRVAAVVT